jgi:hypothetical protein
VHDISQPPAVSIMSQHGLKKEEEIVHSNVFTYSFTAFLSIAAILQIISEANMIFGI